LPLAIVHLCSAIHTLVAYHSAADTMAACNASHMTATGQQHHKQYPARVMSWKMMGGGV